ncbi:CP family cyanate transporter-like MFS transporter [Conyzicola nivalis]|uniref:CP family cyanate transporter-like MFS transporter n=1 Tax=Conyzicola nivalis TaxID=1477021 RepID=A0ABV2QIL1_9MICO
MPPTRPLPLWGGRTVALLAVIAVALSLRTAVASISPIIAEIREDIPLTNVGIGLLGMLPPIFFALSGFVGPLVSRRLGLELAIVVSIAVMAAGHLVRAASGSFTILLIGSALVLMGVGICNVLLPPVVKRYFPDRIGLVTATYATIMSISTAVPSLLAVPVSDSLGWRFSLAIWAALAGVALLPWLVLLARQRRASAERAADDLSAVEVPDAALERRLWHSPVAIAIVVTFSVSTINVYALFAWLPQILIDIVGVTPAAAGTLLAVFSIAGLPASIIAPILVSRLRSPAWIIVAGVVSFLVGYIGLLAAPGALTVVWVLLLGLGPILFPVCLVLINTRTRSHTGSVALSGFAQAIGYSVGAFGPLIVGVLHDATGGWTLPLVFLLATTLAAIFGAVVLSKPAFVEDQLAR